MPQKKTSSKTKPQKKAVAIKYDQQQDAAPRLVGKGTGVLADKIITLAKEHGIPIQANADLVEILSHLNLNQEIPAETYVLVAEILAFVYRTNQSYTPPKR
ncbi:MAG: EscU/YscU/HrcU family type III secretion system export apparatus switch protein [Proteobacteria bacterium]|nr:FhlB domain-containing protein [Desulfobulbaceae bacterium]MBU4153672.1 EscU/YscU/HrcU family type III secretion system export apparatus switch protein [Pseudomonadota bacterium]MDP2105975.1 EscU/YscU/HrcU family type III secretion system export apparatus switch protein [Desulfobulbaceae bacterium]